MEPAEFIPIIYLYVVKCPRATNYVELNLTGSRVFQSDGSQMAEPWGMLRVDLPVFDVPHVRKVASCPDGVNWDSELCETYTLDVYRIGSHHASVSVLTVTSDVLMELEPPFEPSVRHYTTKVLQNQPFSISASGQHPMTRVGIQFKGPASQSGLGADNGCHLASSQHRIWEIETGIAGTGNFIYEICAVPGDGGEIAKYFLKIEVIKYYSTKLTSIDIDGRAVRKLSDCNEAMDQLCYVMEPRKFHQDHLSYTVLVHSGTKKVGISAKSEDEEAKISVAQDTEAPSHGKRGQLAKAFDMPENKEVSFLKPPKWSTTVQIMVLSSDKTEVRTYVVTLKEHKNKFCNLKNITLGENTSCLGGLRAIDINGNYLTEGKKDDDETNEFHPNHFEYSCNFQWWVTKWGSIVPHADTANCTECDIRAPDPEVKSWKHLALELNHSEHTVSWKDGETWQRHFILGEQHWVPIKVIAADRYTHNNYRVRLTRVCPWWMDTEFNRQVAHLSQTISFLMAFPNPGILMMLSKYIQFVVLTTEISGIPSAYEYFAHQLNKGMSFGFNFGGHLDAIMDQPQEALEQKKKDMIALLKRKAGVPHPKLLMEYCYALRAGGKLAANVVFSHHNFRAEELIEAMQEKNANNTKDRLLLTDSASLRGVHGANQTMRRLLESADTAWAINSSRLLAAELSDYDGYEHDDSAPIRRLGDYEKLWYMKESDFEKWVEEGKKRTKNGKHITEDSYPLMDCESKEIIVEMTNVFMFLHELQIIKGMMKSTSGTFILSFLGLTTLGSSYMLYYETVMKGNQKRPKMLEPVAMWLFIFDYALIDFMKSCAKIINEVWEQHKKISLVVFRPNSMTVTIFCVMSIILYPCCFVAWTYWRIKSLISSHRLVYDGDQESWTDPECTAIKVTLKPKVPGWIPLLPQIMTNVVRSAVPILNEEGKPLRFGKFGEDAEAKQQNRKAAADRDLAEEEKDIDAKLAAITNVQNHHDKRRKDRLQQEKFRAAKVRERAEQHRDTLAKVVKEAKDLKTDLLEQTCPPWLHKNDESVHCKPDKEDEGTPYTVISMYDLWKQNWQPKKNRDDVERLDDEEVFAMMQFIRSHLRDEERMLKYNILTVAPQAGYLKPKEPMKPDKMVSDKYKNKYQGDNWWLDTLADYKETEAPFDHNPWLEQFKGHNEYIENKYGERLVYMGNDSTGHLFGLGYIIPGGFEGGRLEWLSEPEEGWKEWEKNTLHGAENAPSDSTIRYADKWQWIVYDKWEEPWYGDEADEGSIKLFGLLNVKTDSIPFYSEIAFYIKKVFKDRVPLKVPYTDQMEIRKYVWSELMVFMDMKLKIMWASYQHPRYYREISLAQMAEIEFHEALLFIEKGEPNPEKRLPHEVIVDFGGGRNRELMDFTVMKFEDMYPWDKEPWWGKCDQAKKGEMKVMFNHPLFWSREGDEELEQACKNDELIPPAGYCHSPYFNSYPNEDIGLKRFDLLKPDASGTEVEIKLQMKHVLPLMKYTDLFKVNVPINSLELSYKQDLKIVIGGAKKGQQWKYTFERFTTLLQIALLSFDVGSGFQTCCILLTLETMNFMMKLYTSIVARQDSEGGDDDDDPANKLVTIKKVEHGNQEPEEEEEGEKAFKPVQEVLAAFGDVDVAVYALRCMVLAFLLLAQYKKLIHPAICAVLCIWTACFTMVYMNVVTFKDEFIQLIKDTGDSLSNYSAQLWTNYIKLRAWLGGDNFFGIEFVEFEQSGAQTCTADKIGLMVPELGVAFAGEAIIDVMLPVEEQRAAEMDKKMAFYVHHLEGDDDVRPKSIRDHVRYEQDIVPSLNVVLQRDQLLLRQAIPQIMATVQCVNHSSSPLTRPQYDSYLTLFKPEDWEPEFENDKERVKQMLDGWKEQVRTWFKDYLGAVESDRTNTKHIVNQLSGMLTEECTGSTHRDITRVLFKEVAFPKKGSWKTNDLTGKAAYIMVTYDTESIKRTFPVERCSTYGKIVQIEKQTGGNANGNEVNPDLTENGNGANGRSGNGNGDADGNVAEDERELDTSKHYYVIKFDTALDVPIPLNVTKVRFALWAQVDSAKEELICYSSEVDVKELKKDMLINVLMHSKWRHSGQRLVPDCGEDRDPEEVRRDKEKEKEAQLMMTPFQKTKSQLVKKTMYFLGCQCFKYCRGMSEEEKKKTRGVLKIKLLTLHEEDEEEDQKTVTAVRNVIEGDSAMNLGKLARHADRWVDLGKFFGVYLSQEDLNYLSAHLQKIEDVRKSWTPGLSFEEKKQSLEKAEIRRHLADDVAMEKALLNFRDDIARLENRLKKENEDGIMPCPAHRLQERRISGRRVWHPRPTGGAGLFSCFKQAAQKEEDGTHNSVNALLDQLHAYQTAQSAGAKQILHYVVMSEHLKPSKNWRPDAISPHVAYLVTNEYEDVPKVAITGANWAGEVVFDRELQGDSTDPVITNGRLTYKAQPAEAREMMPDLQDGEFLYLYWDGTMRWVVSPTVGLPPPYGIRGHEANRFIWVKDNKATPDQIDQHWHVWPTDGTAKWTEDDSIKIQAVDDTSGKTKDLFMEQAHQQMEEQMEGEEGFVAMLKSSVKEAIGEVMALFQRHHAKKIEPELKDCLVSLSTKDLAFAWKDDNIERLAPFRMFLLKEFGTYENAWVHLTRGIYISRPKARTNLAAMFEKTERLMREAHDDSGGRTTKDYLAKRATTQATLESMTITEGEGGQSPAGGRPARSEKKDPFDPPWPKERKARMRAYIEDNPLRLSLPEGDEENVGKDAQDEVYEHIAAHIMDRLDLEKDAKIEAQEIRMLYDGKIGEDITDPVLISFKKWLDDHPLYSDFSLMWADLSDDIELGIDDFTEAIKGDMHKFITQKEDSKMTMEDYAKKMFIDLDVQYSTGISLRELKPSSGESLAAAKQSIVKFNIPLRYIKEIREEGHKKVGNDGNKSLRFILNPQFENSPEWTAFRLALNPDWECMPNSESIRVSMSQSFFDLWHQVIQECEMKTPQEFIRYYDGAYEDHPVISGTYVRQGQGIQRWGDGRVYEGRWQAHLYSGDGALFSSVEDHKQGNVPMYRGEWLNGKRHGRGMMQWDQDTTRRTDKENSKKGGRHVGIHKVYNGEFRDDLFHGQGRLFMGKAVPTVKQASKKPGIVSLGKTEPQHLLVFEGEFESDWYQVDKWARKHLAEYKQESEELTVEREEGEKVREKDLNLHKLKKSDKQKQVPKYMKFFNVDAKKVQRAGQPLPDLAFHFYSQKGNDALHMKRGVARYADGTEYSGEFKDGRPHGYCEYLKRMELNERAEYVLELSTYDGYFKHGERSGKGNYKTSDGLTYQGEWLHNMRHGNGKQELAPNLVEAYGYQSYDGEWQMDQRHGFGKMVFGPNNCFEYEGMFENDLRHGRGKVYLHFGLQEKMENVSEKKVGGFGGGFVSAIAKGVGLGSSAESKVLLMHGIFEDNHLTTGEDVSEWAWCRLVQPGMNRGCFYYGQVDKLGQRKGKGTLYDDADAKDSTEFMACVEEGKEYAEENWVAHRKKALEVDDVTKVKFTVYSGTWDDDRPHGEGIQHFEHPVQRAKGTYLGQFKDGMRHGRGIWKTNHWTYRPIDSNKDVENWRDDKMHGVGIVEDPDTVHVNVIFDEGICQMPFTDSGAPSTDFERNELIGKKLRKARVNASMLNLEKRGGIEGSRPDDKMKGMGFYDMTNIQNILQAETSKAKSFMRRGSSNKSLVSNDSGTAGAIVAYRRQTSRSNKTVMDEQPLVREPTDLNLPDEDIFITGGTLDNEVLNGYFFKMAGTFGVTVYRLVKRTGYMHHVSERFLYRDIKTKCWVIGPIPMHGLAVTKGCAFVEDDSEDHKQSPSDCHKHWYVWHPHSKAMKHFGVESSDEEDEHGKKKPKRKKPPVDQIEARSIVGFEVVGSTKNVAAGLMLRTSRELYGRPVYEVQNGGMFLYWLQDGGSLDAGTQGDHAPSEAPVAKSLYENTGHWIIAAELGETSQGRTSVAYVEDPAVTPDQITGEWHCRIAPAPEQPLKPRESIDTMMSSEVEGSEGKGGKEAPDAEAADTAAADSGAKPKRTSLKLPEKHGAHKSQPRSPRTSHGGHSDRGSTPQRSPREEGSQAGGVGGTGMMGSFIASLADFDGDQFEPCPALRLEMEEAAAKGGELIVKFDDEDDHPPPGAGVAAMLDEAGEGAPLLGEEKPARAG